jgi:UDP-glucose 4-epimerase
MTEAQTASPEDSYGIAKYAVELELRACHELFGLRYVIFRPHNVFGPRQNIGDRYRNVIGIFMNQIMKGEPLTIFGDGTQTRAFSYIGDVAPHIARSALIPEAFNQTFNIGADTPYSVNELARVVGAAFGVEPEIRHLPPRNEVLNAYASHEKAAHILDAKPSVSLAEGIGRMAAWAKAVGARRARRYGEIVVERNMPPVWLE